MKFGKIKFDFRMKNPDKAINYLVIALMSYHPITYCFNQIVNRFIQYGAQWDTALCLLILMGFVANAFIPILSRTNIFSILLIPVFMCLFSITMILRLPGEQFANDGFLKFFFTILPYVFVGCAIHDYNSLMNDLKRFRKVIIVVMIIWIILSYTSSISEVADEQLVWQNNMKVAYTFLPFTLLSVYCIFENKKLSDVLWAVASFISLIVLGTRGPILFFLIFIIIVMLRKIRSVKLIFATTILVLIGIFLYFNFYDILLWLDELFKNYGIENAAINKMLYANDLSNGRNEIHESINILIKGSSFWGYGLYADRGLIDIYTHFLPTELILNYGYFVGISLLIILIFSLSFVLMKYRKNENVTCFLLIFSFSGIIKLFFSGSYLDEVYFYLMLGMISYLISKNKKV